MSVTSSFGIMNELWQASDLIQNSSDSGKDMVVIAQGLIEMMVHTIGRFVLRAL